MIISGEQVNTWLARETLKQLPKVFFFGSIGFGFPSMFSRAEVLAKPIPAGDSLTGPNPSELNHRIITGVYRITSRCGRWFMCATQVPKRKVVSKWLEPVVVGGELPIKVRQVLGTTLTLRLLTATEWLRVKGTVFNC
jgi:hypothetical protein